MTKQDLVEFCARQNEDLSIVVRRLNDNGQGIILVIDDGRRLIGLITDGDVRRHVLAGHGLSGTAGDILREKEGSEFQQPVTVPPGTSATQILDVMTEKALRHIPVIDSEGRLADLILLSELTQDHSLPMRAVVMAGGFGKRLHPLTLDTPKPMLNVGDRPMLERTLDRLRNAGIRNVRFTLHHQAAKVTEHFGDGRKFGVDVDYVIEDKPMGTAGALSLMERPDETILVINGDIITDVNFREMLSFHKDHDAVMTVGVRHYEVEVPYGVVETDGVNVRALVEKPKLDFFVNAGIYLLEPSVYDYLPKSGNIDMPDLMTMLLTNDRSVINFPILEYWLDIGRPDDYEQAQNDFVNGRFGQ